jgi:hypothetical protein
MGLLSTLMTYGQAAKQAVLGFPERRRLTARQDEIISAYDELTWDEIRSTESADTDYDQRKQELQEEYFDLEQQKVDTWDSRTPAERADDRIAAILDDKPPETRETVLNQLIPRYLDGEEEFGESRPRIMDRLDRMPTSDAYQDTQQRAYMTDADIRGELFNSRLQQYSDRIADEDRQQMVEQVQRKKAYREEQQDEDGQRFRNVDLQHQHLINEVDAIVDRYSEADRRTLKRWLIPLYGNEGDIFEDDRRSMVDRLVNRYNEQYDGLDRFADVWIDRALFRRIAAANTQITDTDAAELSVYADEIRQLPDRNYNVDQSAAPDTVDNGGQAQTDGGRSDTYTPTSTTGRTGPSYLDGEQETIDETVGRTLEDTAVENEFITTAGHRYQKIADEDGFRYERNGEPISRQAYAGAAAHRLPGS